MAAPDAKKLNAKINPWLLCGILLLTLLLAANAANAYYSFVRSGVRTRWPVAIFSQTPTQPSGFAASVPDLGTNLDIGVSPNNNDTGLLVLADAQYFNRFPDAPLGIVTCANGGSPYGPALVGAYLSVFNAMATWSSIPSSQVDFAFACLLSDINATSFDDNDDEPATLDIFRNDEPHFNGINEIVFDDTTNGDLINSLNIGIDPAVLLGLSFPFDTNQNLITASDSTGIIDEGFVIINRTNVLFQHAPTINLQGVITHELGHLLGLGHTPSINRGQGDDTNVPTMYFKALTDSFQTTTLEPDDIAGITVSYPASGEPLSSFGSISGQVSNGFSNVVGSAVIAQDLGTGPSQGKEISVIIGGNPDTDDTHYVIEGVPAGDYVVRLLPLDGSSPAGGVNSSSGGNIDSIFTTPPYSFTTQIFANSIDESSFTPVDVVTGDDSPNINFILSNLDSSGLDGQLYNDCPDCCQSFGGTAAGFSSSMAVVLTLPFATIFMFKRSLRRKKNRESDLPDPTPR